ncbi:MAG: glycoside hydrolase N-terminal domain-containing protein, partial [Isosphaeraceae bacterium]
METSAPRQRSVLRDTVLTILLLLTTRVQAADPVFTGRADPPDQLLSLWYSRPAGEWLEAVPIGNSRLGGMVYGGHYYQFEEYLRRPGLAEVEEGTGVMDHPHRGHWEESFARKIGVPGVYDIAVQRTAWMTTLMTNWAGDAG